MTEKKEDLLETRQAVLSDSLDDEPPYKIHGVAIGPGDVTNGKNGRKTWPAETLQKAADTLSGQPLVRDHINSVLGNIGEVTKSTFKEGEGVLFEAELDDKELAEKINNGRLDVSARIKHLPKEELEYDEELDAHIVSPPAVFDNLSVVNSGAAPSNSVDLGEADEMDAAELQEALEEVEPEPEAEEAEDETEEVSDDEAGEAELAQGYVIFEEQVTDGESVEVMEATYDSAPFFISIHPVGDSMPLADPPLGSPIGEVGPFRAGRVVTDVEVPLRSPLGESEEVYAVLYYSDGRRKGDPIARRGRLIKDSGVVRVDDSVVGEQDRVQLSDDEDEVEEADELSDGESEQDEAQSDDQSEAVTDDVDDPNRARKAVKVSEFQFNTKIMDYYEVDSEDLPEGVEELSDPVVVDEAELSDLQEQASRSENEFEELREDISELSSIREEKEELEEEVEELREKASEVEEVKRMKAEELAEAADAEVVSADDFMHLELSELRERVADLPAEEEEEVEEEELEETDPEPQSGDVENEELEEDGDEVDEAEIEELEEQLEWYEERGWESPAEELREELEELKQ